MLYKAAVVGLGKIGLGLDYEKSASDVVLTHSSAFSSHPGFELVAGVDADPSSCEKFKKKYGRPAYSTVAALFENQECDVVAIAVPTPNHFEVFQQVVKNQTKGILMEKPLAPTLTEAETMMKLAAQSGTVVLANYFRRFEPGACHVRDLIEKGDLGEIEKVSATYTNGIFNNGSHLVDFFLGTLGELREAQCLSRSGNDTVDMKLVFERAPVYLLSMPAKYYALNEFRILGSEGSVEYQRGGEKIQVRKVEKNDLFPGFQALENNGKEIKTDFGRYQYHVLSYFLEVLSGKRKEKPELLSGLHTARAMDLIAREISGV